MTARLDSVAKCICEESGWQISNLSLQKLLYLSQVEAAIQFNGSHLVDEAFEAWDYGPVVPALYRRIKIFGSAPVRNVFYNALKFRDGDPRLILLKAICKKYLGKRPGELVEISHWSYGAWARKYEPNTRGIAITDEDIAYEIRNRRIHSAVWARINGGSSSAVA